MALKTTSTVKVKLFYDAESAAKECGISIRQFRRVTADHGITALCFGTARSRHMWRPEDVARAKSLTRREGVRA